MTATPKNITLYGFGRHPYGPDLSPFVCKLETFLRLAKLPYTYCAGNLSGGSSGRLPRLEIHDVPTGRRTVLEDSQRIIAYLIREYHLTMDDRLSGPDVTTGKALMQILHSSLYHCILRNRWVDHFDRILELLTLGLPMIVKKIALPLVGRKATITELNYHGNGDLTDEEYHAVALSDVEWIEQLIAQSAANGGHFVLASSGELPCSFDAATFAFLLAVASGPPEWTNNLAGRYIEASTVLQGYLGRVQALAFPDMAAIQQEGRETIARERSKDGAGVVLVVFTLVLLLAAVGAVIYGIWWGSTRH